MVISDLFDAGFKLGGSRRMAEKYPDDVKIGPDTDWDFYAEDTKSNRDFLAANGFERLECPNKNYWDDLLVDIFKHHELPIEVLLRNQVSVYSETFEGISAQFFINKLWKSSPVRDQDVPQAAFKDSVCKTLNKLFRVNGYVEDNFIESPF